MTDPEVLRDLLGRVEAATGEGQALFADVARAVLPGIFRPIQDRASDDWGFKQAYYRFIAAEAWESAALALCERVLPGWRVQLFEDDTGWLCRIKRTTPYALIAGDEQPRVKAPALALISAMLKALVGQGTASVADSGCDGLMAASDGAAEVGEVGR